MPPDDAERHDPARVVELRRGALERAGFAAAQAAELATTRVEVPLQDALQLVRAGFAPGAAFEMLTSGERPVF